MMKTLLAAAAALTLFATPGFLIAQYSEPFPEPQPYGGGTVEACGDAPGGDPSVELLSPTGSGNLTITSVTINGVTIPSSQYTVNNNGSTSPEVVFHNPTPGAPAQGADLCVYATSADSNGL